MYLYLAVIALLLGLVALYTIHKSVKLEEKVLDSLKKIEKKLKV